VALRALVSQYSEVIRQAWKTRRELDTPPRRSYEAEFLPAHLEIIEKPFHPAPLWALRTISALVLSVVLVALFGHLDIVAVAHGKLVPSARVKIIQPALTGVVRTILVRNGMHVVPGQVLLELDPTQAAADADKATATRVDAELAIARAHALLQAQTDNKAPTIDSVPGAAPDRHQQTQAYAIGVFHEYRNKLAALRAQLDQREAELKTVNDEIDKLNVTAPLMRQRAKNYQALAAESYVAKDIYLDKEQSALKEEGALRSESDRAIALTAAVEEQKQEIATTLATFRREQLADLDRAQQALAQSTDDQAKADVRKSLTKMSAPVAGTVQNLAVHTVGGVVTTAQALLEIVPEDTLEVEANVDNKDIGFLEAGQDAVVKIEAFPYTRFGYLRGKVLAISNDSVPSKTNGLQYVVRVELPGNQMAVGRRKLQLTPGMQVVAEIRTGRRTVADYFFSPLLETAGQSMRER
jgi:hemolysin D